MMNQVGDEYYGLMRYAKTNVNEEVYALDRFGNQFYLDTGNNNQIFAKRNGEIYYAKNCRGEPILPLRENQPYYYFDEFQQPKFPTNDQNIKIYATHDRWEIYPNNGVTDIYLVSSGGDQCYARTPTGQFYYASRMLNGEKVQFIAKSKNNENITLVDGNNHFKYPLNLTLNKPIYPVNHGKETYVQIEDKEVYGCNTRNLPVYAQVNGDDYLATDEKQQEYYASYKNTEFYPKLKSNKQFYKTNHHGMEIYASLGPDKQYYAKNAAMDDILAKDNDQTYYCQQKQIENYPQTARNDQFYRVKDEEEIPAKNDLGLCFYARKHNGERFYPMSFVPNEEHLLIESK